MASAQKKQKLNPPSDVDLCNPDDCDVVFLVEGQSIPYVKALLRHQSPVFARMFSEHWAEGQVPQKPIELRQKKHEDIVALLRVLKPNGGDFISGANVERLLELADEYELKSVAALCEKFIMDLRNCKDVAVYMVYLTMAAYYRLDSAVATLLKDLVRRISDDNVETFLQLAKKYDCLRPIFDYVKGYMFKNWKLRSGMALDAIILAEKYELPTVTNVFIPIVASFCNGRQIDAAKGAISLELYATLIRKRLEFVEKEDKKTSAPPAPKRRSSSSSSSSSSD